MMNDCQWRRAGDSIECDACHRKLKWAADRQLPSRTCTAKPSTTLTQLTETLWLHQCRNCDWTLEADSPAPMEHVCGRDEVVRLGDQLKAGLEYVGIYEEDVAALLEKIGLPCGCDARRKFLNKLDKAVGLGEKIESFKAFMKWGE